MSSGTGAAVGNLPLATLLEIEEVCDRFEHAWRAGERPDLASFLAESSGPARARMLHGLLTIELDYRLSTGETPDPPSYRDRFPEHHEVIAAVFATLGLAGSGMPTASGHGPPGSESLAALLNQSGQGTGLPHADLGPATLEALRGAGYEIEGELGRGGMGVVYLARKMALNRPCALKMILAGQHAGSSMAARFRAEADAVARLRHPGIVQIYHVGEVCGLPFLELEYLPGGSLDRMLDGRPWPPRKAAGLVEVLARAIAEAHAKGIVHRDLKPANVLLEADGSPKVADFGLAKVLDSDSELTRTQTVLGSPTYMAPEQAEGRSHLVGATSDVYALGAILYTLLAGSPPFRAATALETLAQVKSADPVPPSRFQPGLPRDVETICLKCLEKAPGRRYSTARELAEDLRRYQSGEPIVARPAPFWERGWKWARRRPAVAAALAAGVTAVGILLGGALYYNTRLQAMLQRTQAAERDAVDRGKLVIEAYSRLVSGVQEKLGETAATRSIRQALLTTAIEGLDKVAGSHGAPVAPDLYLAVAHLKLGEILRQVGRASDARLQLERSRLLAERLAAADPSDLAAAECVRDGCLGLGELILRDERPREAEGFFRRALEQAKVIMAADPGRAGARPGLAEAYHRLGRTLDAAGEMDAAGECFRTMQQLAEQWTDDEPQSLAARDLLACSFDRLGRVRRYHHDYAAAGVAYRQAIAMGRGLWEAEPSNIVFKAHLALALLDAAILAIERGEHAEARPLCVEAERLYKDLAEADPEDREAQVWLVHAQYHFGRLERDERQFARAEEVFHRALDRLRQLDRQGKLEGRPAFKYRHMNVLEQEIAFCAAAPRILDDPSVVRSQLPIVAVDLLRLRARTLAERNRLTELAATIETLCGYEEGDWEAQYHLTRTLAHCMRYLEDGRPPGITSEAWSNLRRRCADRALAALSRAVERGYRDANQLEVENELTPIRELPGFQTLVAQMKQRPIPPDVRYPVR